MKLDQLRKIIREEVRAAVKEELQEVMNEAVRAASTPTQVVEEKVISQPTPMKQQQSNPGVGNSITEMLNQTKANMTPEEYKNVYTGTSDMIQKPNFASMMAGNMGMTDTGGPQPGLDISQFDFVKKAGAVYKAAEQKTKEKYGVA